MMMVEDDQAFFIDTKVRGRHTSGSILNLIRTFSASKCNTKVDDDGDAGRKGHDADEGMMTMTMSFSSTIPYSN